MKVLLISANREDINMPTLPMGLGCVAAATQKDGHDVRFVDLLTADDISSASPLETSMIRRWIQRSSCWIRPKRLSRSAVRARRH